MKPHHTKKILLTLALVVAVVALYFHFLTPQAWRWGAANLQVHIHSVAYADPAFGAPRWDESGFGWCKRDFLLSGWIWRRSSGTSSHGTDFTQTRIVGVTPRGVSVRVVHRDSRGEAFNFDKTVFVTAEPLRMDVSDKLYITAHFEPHDT